jgi:outer membrane protein TolC
MWAAVIVLVVLLLHPVRAPAESARALARQAISKNPSIAAVEARAAALREQVRRAGVWSDPTVAIEYSNIPIDAWVLGEHPMSGLQLKLKQTFPFPGKTRLRREVARQEVKEEEHRLAERKVQLAAMVGRAYHSLALTRQLRAVTARHIRLLKKLIDAVRIKYEVGKVGQHELLRLTVLRDKLEDDLESFDRDDRVLSASLNAALHRPAERKVATPRRTVAPEPPRSVAALVRRAQAQRPRLALLAQQTATARARARQAGREKYPDITAWAGYRVRIGAGTDAGTDFFALGLSVPLTFFQNEGRWGTVQRAAKARARAAEAERQAELDRIRAGLEAALARGRRAAREARAYRDKLLPAAQRTLDATLSAYSVDRADFASLHQAELQLLDFERTLRRAETTAALAAVEIDALTGGGVADGGGDR